MIFLNTVYCSISHLVSLKLTMPLEKSIPRLSNPNPHYQSNLGGLGVHRAVLSEVVPTESRCDSNVTRCSLICCRQGGQQDTGACRVGRTPLRASWSRAQT